MKQILYFTVNGAIILEMTIVFIASLTWALTTKISHGLLNTNHQNAKYYGTSSAFPCCFDNIETLTHIFICQQQEVETHRKEQLKILPEELYAIGTSNLISTAILHGITSWIEMELGFIDTFRCPFSRQ